MKITSKKEYLAPRNIHSKKITDFFQKNEDPPLEKRIGSQKKSAKNVSASSSKIVSTARGRHPDLHRSECGPVEKIIDQHKTNPA